MFVAEDGIIFDARGCWGGLSLDVRVVRLRVHEGWTPVSPVSEETHWVSGFQQLKQSLLWDPSGQTLVTENGNIFYARG